MLTELLATIAVAGLGLWLTAPARRRPVIELVFVQQADDDGPVPDASCRRTVHAIAAAVLDAHPEAEIRASLVTYREGGSPVVSRACDLAGEVQDLGADLLHLTGHPAPSLPEEVNEALGAAVLRMTWNEGRAVTRLVLAVGRPPGAPRAPGRSEAAEAAEAVRAA